jgi:chaperone modulatory protein CbpM
MHEMTSITGVLLDDAALTIEELARACDVEPDWVVRRVQAGILGGQATVQVTTWRFRSGDLLRARRLVRVERDFDADEEMAALVVDLSDEVHRLRARLHALGMD